MRLSAILWNLFCTFEGIRAILTELSDEALTITIRLIDIAIFPLRSAYSLYEPFFREQC